LAFLSLVLLSLPFVIYAVTFGIRGLSSNLSGETYLYTAENWLPNLAVFGHMTAGAIITLLAPFQLLPVLRRKYPKFHRQSGRLIVLLAIPSALGGLTYILMRRTIGGSFMDVAFAIYGLCFLMAAIQTIRYARARRWTLHREWALRFFVLAIASWLFRLHYTVWYLLTDGLGSEPDLTGIFDRVQTFAFFVPYLIGLEIYLRRHPVRAEAIRSDAGYHS
jgi:hypothetical protein